MWELMLATNFGSPLQMVTKVGSQILATKFGFVPDWYRDSHYKDKRVVEPSYLCNGNTQTWKDRLYIETRPSIPVTKMAVHFDGLVQERSNSIANALELRLSALTRQFSLFPLGPDTLHDQTSHMHHTHLSGMSTFKHLQAATSNISRTFLSLQWHNNEHDSITNPQTHDCILNS